MSEPFEKMGIEELKKAITEMSNWLTTFRKVEFEPIKDDMNKTPPGELKEMKRAHARELATKFNERLGEKNKLIGE